MKTKNISEMKKGHNTQNKKMTHKKNTRKVLTMYSTIETTSRIKILHNLKPK